MAVRVGVRAKESTGAKTLNIRVVLAPVELGPYNRHAAGNCLKKNREDRQLRILSVTGFIEKLCSMHVVSQKS